MHPKNYIDVYIILQEQKNIGYVLNYFDMAYKRHSNRVIYYMHT